MSNKYITLPNGCVAGPSVHLDLATGEIRKDENYKLLEGKAKEVIDSLADYIRNHSSQNQVK